MPNQITIDGSFGEGGGSIARFSIAFACVLQKPVIISNIRANRKNPGLRTQHLAGIRLIQQIFGGKLEGDRIGSTQISYTPELVINLRSKHIQVRIDTAASLGLIIQTLQLAAYALPEEITIELVGGATYGLWAPSIDYIIFVTMVYLKYFNTNFEIKIGNHGFYPKGEARLVLIMKPANLHKIESLSFIEREEKSQIQGISIASKHLQGSKVAERTAKAALNLLNQNGFNAQIEPLYVDTLSIGSGITIWTKSKYPFGSSFIGQKQISAENVGKSVAVNFLKDWKNGGVLDEFMADQIIPFMSLTPVEIFTGPLTEHTKTNIWIANHFQESHFEISNIKNKLYSIKTT